MKTCSLWAKTSVLKWTPEPRSHWAFCRSAGAVRFSTTRERTHTRTHTHTFATHVWCTNADMQVWLRNNVQKRCCLNAGPSCWAPSSTPVGLLYPSVLFNGSHDDNTRFVVSQARGLHIAYIHPWPCNHFHRENRPILGTFAVIFSLSETLIEQKTCLLNLLIKEGPWTPLCAFFVTLVIA